MHVISKSLWDPLSEVIFNYLPNDTLILFSFSVGDSKELETTLLNGEGGGGERGTAHHWSCFLLRPDNNTWRALGWTQRPISSLELGGTALGFAPSEKRDHGSAHGGVFKQVSFVFRWHGKIADVAMDSLKPPASPASLTTPQARGSQFRDSCLTLKEWEL